ncbi:2-keto-3-deoxy-galactonokinase [Hungatella hathewayi]|nr:2-keto-3-deoxy-galactonokinase [Hungatella hathewayi]
MTESGCWRPLMRQNFNKKVGVSLYFFYFDSGTTNTRACLLKDRTIICRGDIPVGSRDSALHQDRTVLISALKQLYDQLLTKSGITDTQVAEIYMSGMISSPSGLKEIEHLSTPVDFKKLKSSIVVYYESQFFQRNVHIIPGIKTLPQGTTASVDTVVNANNMRGEETELLGILHRCPGLASGRSIILLPGSHTQAAFLLDGTIENISSTITGELYHALAGHTILGSSINGEKCTELLPNMVCMGYDIVHRYGFNRALYVVRSMDLFAGSTLAERRSYLEGVINGGVMDAIVSVTQDKPATIAVAGPHMQYEIFSAFADKLFPQFKITEVPVTPSFPFAVEGFLSLMEQ